MSMRQHKTLALGIVLGIALTGAMNAFVISPQPAEAARGGIPERVRRLEALVEACCDALDVISADLEELEVTAGRMSFVSDDGEPQAIIVQNLEGFGIIVQNSDGSSISPGQFDGDYVALNPQPEPPGADFLVDEIVP